MHSTAHIFHTVADQFLVNIQTDVVHSLHGGASLVVSESARSLSSAFLHQALLHDLFIQTIHPKTRCYLAIRSTASHLPMSQVYPTISAEGQVAIKSAYSFTRQPSAALWLQLCRSTRC